MIFFDSLICISLWSHLIPKYLGIALKLKGFCSIVAYMNMHQKWDSLVCVNPILTTQILCIKTCIFWACFLPCKMRVILHSRCKDQMKYSVCLVWSRYLLHGSSLFPRQQKLLIFLKQKYQLQKEEDDSSEETNPVWIIAVITLVSWFSLTFWHFYSNFQITWSLHTFSILIGK